MKYISEFKSTFSTKFFGLFSEKGRFKIVGGWFRTLFYPFILVK